MKNSQYKNRHFGKVNQDTHLELLFHKNGQKDQVEKDTNSEIQDRKTTEKENK